MKKSFSAALLAAILLLVFCASPAFAKTTPAGQTVGTVLFYVENARGEEILVSKILVSEMEADMKAGKIDDALHNYSLLDKFVTTLHQEAQGFTVQAFIDYAREKSPIPALRALPLALSGKSEISFWEIDQTGYDDLDTYSYADLYETPRYNFPLLYEYWDYAKQDYYDPAGKLTRAQVIDLIFANGEPETVILSVRAFSQRYMVTTEKFGVDYNMENYWQSQNLLDNARTMRVMKPMTRAELYNKTSTAMDTRYWTANFRLRPENAPDIAALGRAAAPTAVMTEAGDNYYIRFACDTPGATILYNHNFISPSYTPTSPYGDGAVVVPKEYFKSGTVTMTARAIKEGFSDAGVVTLTLSSSGAEQNPEAPPAAFSDVPENAWFAEAARYVTEKGLFDFTSGNAFSPGAPMTRAMLVTALYRAEASPRVASADDFSDVTRGTPLAAAVSWARDAGVVSGMGDGSFMPDASVTREQIAAMLYRYAGHKSADTGAKGDLAAFTDAEGISGWASEALAWAVGAGVVSGMGDGSVAPQGMATRAQVAQMLRNFMK
ncbi:MAG: S-layer homology domain-containing protein [Clostridiales Family XIII bacterium]|nr:S-layer homology domain-containing protein [Clostridiales Family XIII bacterium]